MLFYLQSRARRKVLHREIAGIRLTTNPQCLDLNSLGRRFRLVAIPEGVTFDFEFLYCIDDYFSG